jgi:hypothetical protein
LHQRSINTATFSPKFADKLGGSRPIFKASIPPYRKDGSKRIADNALVAITLMIAESNPADNDRQGSFLYYS